MKESNVGRERSRFFSDSELMNTDLVGEFGKMAQQAAYICNTSIAFISLLDGDRPFIKAGIGCEFSDIPGIHSLCSIVIENPADSLIIPDLSNHKDLKNHPVCSPPIAIKFYAGLALRSNEGITYGTICVMDKDAGELTTAQTSALQNLKDITVTLIEQRLPGNENAIASKELSEVKQIEPFAEFQKIDEGGDIFKQLFKFSLIPTIIHDLDMNILNVNDSVVKEFGYSKAELAQMKVLELHVKEELAHSKKILKELNSKNHLTVTTSFRRKDGSVFPAEATPTKFIVGDQPIVYVAIKNISFRLDHEREKQELSSVIQNSLNEIYIIDCDHLQFQFLNRGALDNTGYTFEESLKLFPWDLKPEFNKEDFKEFIKPVLSGDEETIIFNTIHERKDKSRYPVEVHLQKIVYQNRQAISAIIIDTSVNKAYEKKLEELNFKISRINSRLRQFAATTAHDLQEPLRMISSFSGLLKKRYSDSLDQKANQYLNFITDGAHRMKHLIHDTLDYAEIEASNFKKQKVNVDEVLKHVQADLESLIREEKVEIVVPEKQIFIESDPILLYRVFLNLFGNSIKYTAPGIAPKLILEATRMDDFWKFSLTDNGIGIKEEYHQKIFTPFARLHSKKDFNGTGIGLSIVQKIIVLHGGKIWVESRPNDGSTFHFTIPVKG